MRLDEYWGVGPKTRELLAESLGVATAIDAIERGDVRALTDAGLPRGRATRVLRHANGGAAMDLLATPDARDVYKTILDIAGEYAVTAAARDRIRILTPLADREAMEARLEDVVTARDTWADLPEPDREAVLAAFEDYDSGGGRRAAVEAALALQTTGVEAGVFAPLADLDAGTLEAAAAALAGLGESGVSEGADDRLDALRGQLGAVEDMAATPGQVVEQVGEGARGADELQDAFARQVTAETGADAARVRGAMVADAADARGFVGETLRELAEDLRAAVEEREETVRAELEGTLEAAEGAVERAVSAVDDIAFDVSLARFALAFELARNLFLADAGEGLQPVTYAVGDHDLPVPRATVPPSHRVAVLTGANSGGKTTLLETLCQVQLLAQMGLPVPASAAEVGPVDAVVFHRRHASFNAGVLESTLRSVVPPLSEGGRTLMLVDEFEAITEPGSDGIFAEGLTPNLELDVDYQPRFETVGRSTPEFIVSRLVADATDRAERTSYETLAEAVGESAVQRTLVDARWQS